MQWVNDLAFLCGGADSITGLTQQVKDPMLLQLQHRSQLQHKCGPWSWNFHILWGQLTKKKK